MLLNRQLASQEAALQEERLQLKQQVHTQTEIARRQSNRAETAALALQTKACAACGVCAVFCARVGFIVLVGVERLVAGGDCCQFYGKCGMYSKLEKDLPIILGAGMEGK